MDASTRGVGYNHLSNRDRNVTAEFAMNHIALESQDEIVTRFVLSLPTDPQGSVLELNGQAVAWVVPAVSVAANGDEPWTDATNERRCDLIDRKHGTGITPAETAELAALQEQMLRFRQRFAPLPLEDARKLHQTLLGKAVQAQAGS